MIDLIKHKRYGATGRPLWLLLYPTHWAFVPAPSVEALLAKYLAENETPYARVFMMHLLSDTDAELTGLYPAISGQRAEMIKMYADERKARAQDFWLADPSTAFGIPGGVAIPF